MDSPDKTQYMQEARIFSNTFTFKDVLCTFNNDDFENNYNYIYPYLLNPEKVNKDLCKSSFFLDFSIEVYYWKFITKTFDEEDVFPLYINSVPYLDSNIPFKKKKKNHDLVGSEILRIARTTKDMINMVLLINLLSSSFNN